MSISWVVFDVGETLLDESEDWRNVAQSMGVPAFTLMGVMGALIAARRSHRDIFGVFGSRYRPDLAARPPKDLPKAENLYPDALPTLASLKRAGYKIGISGNQPAWIEPAIRTWGAQADLIASSASWGIEKPSPKFFERIVRETGAQAREIAYVGDRVDNDILPALAVGMKAIFIKRGPWGYVHAGWPETLRASARINSLSELEDVLAAL
jgi:HAD superfamily hydrolase (TIGR01549 family)